MIRQNDWDLYAEMDDPEAMETPRREGYAMPQRPNLDEFRETRQDPQGPKGEARRSGHPAWLSIGMAAVCGAAAMLWYLQAVGLVPR